MCDATESSSSDYRIVRRIVLPRSHTGNTNGFQFPSEDDDSVQFDTSDAAENGEVLMAAKQYPSIQEFASAIPDHLLLGSLLEHLCCVYEKDPYRSRMLFKVIGQRLAAMNLLSPLAISDEFSTVRLQHNQAFTELLHAASSSLFPQDYKYLNSDAQSLKMRSKDGLFQAQTSRYLSEFEEICRLGRGSYGKVFKVTNKLDGQNYAVKKILIKNVTREDCMKVLREVKVLSSLHHANIVGYHTAWLEHVHAAVTSQKSVSCNFPALKTSLRENNDEMSLGSNSGSSIIFECSDHQESKTQCVLAKVTPNNPSVKESENKAEKTQAMCPKGRPNPEDFVPCVFLGTSCMGVATTAVEGCCPMASWDSSMLTEDEPPIDSQQRNREVQFHLMLYIQMQLCELSLRDWILERNNRFREEYTSPLELYKCVNTEKTLKIFQAILEGVQYIHARGIMHRDLKPRNIFLHGLDCHVKIGDFGLACKDIIVEPVENVPHGSRISGSSHTTGVGTFVYAAPEQLEGSHYDTKSDMYSVGMVALELFQPFWTEMERVKTLGELRMGKVPDTLTKHWPVLSHYIHLLTNPDPSLRPSATHLLQSKLFNDTDEIIHSLQRKVEEQEEEIVQLKRQISELQEHTKNPVGQTSLTSQLEKNCCVQTNYKV
ncbi:eukaryotic translation initiation factor 2-alpha kinase 1 [Arapaima gigas]